MGRPLHTNRNKWQYYTISDQNQGIKLPVSRNGRSCTNEYGCDDLFNGDTIYVEGYKDAFKVTIYENSHNEGTLNFLNKRKATFEIKKNSYLKGKKIFLKKDEVLVFNQFLVHKSGFNSSNKPRVSIQLRFNDLFSLEKITSSFNMVNNHISKIAFKITLNNMI